MINRAAAETAGSGDAMGAGGSGTLEGTVMDTNRGAIGGSIGTMPGRAPINVMMMALISVLFSVLILALIFLAAGCGRERERKTTPHDDSWIKLEQSYTEQSLDKDGSIEFTFHAEQRGAYLIVVADNSSALPLIIQHPKKTCYLFGNGSCELISSPDEVYLVKIFSPHKKPASFTLLVSHSEGKGRFEGASTAPMVFPVGYAHQGSVGVRGSSHYEFTTAAEGIYTIVLSGGHSDLAWRLFDRPAFDIILQECDTHAGAGAESCRTAPLGANKRYYLKVEELSGVPGNFRLQVIPP